MTLFDQSSAHGPFRTCIGCRQRVAKCELLRVTAGNDEHGREVVQPDPTGTMPGRGAHLHPTSVCYDLAARRKAFGRALKIGHGPPSDAVREYVTTVTAHPSTRNRSSSS